jgi:hypothetical protein
LHVSVQSLLALAALSMTASIDQPQRQKSANLTLLAPTGLVADFTLLLPNHDENALLTLLATPTSGAPFEQQSPTVVHANENKSLTITLGPRGADLGSGSTNDLAAAPPRDLANADLATRDLAPTLPVATGSYTGTSAPQSITQPGFAPALVVVSSSGQPSVVRTSAMSGNVSFALDSIGLTANQITSLDASGFSLGTDAAVNGLTQTYFWAAFPSTPTLAIGSYNGDGTNPRNINTGFTPSWVWILPVSATAAPIEHFAGEAATSNIRFGCSGEESGQGFLGIAAGGFNVTGGARTNASGTQYFWVAWQDGGDFAFGSYSDGNNSHLVATHGLTPRAVFVKPIATSGSDCGSWGLASMPAGSSYDVTGTLMNDGITALANGSFTTGANGNTCGAGGLCYWFAAGN